MIVLDSTIVNVALPSIRADLGFTQTSLAWVVNGYLLTFGGFLLLGGRLGDLFGHRRLFIAGITLFTVASLACGLAMTQGLLVAARVIQGLGGAATSAVALSLMMSRFLEPAERAKAMGVFGFVAAGGGTLGVLLGGVLTDLLNWHWIFDSELLLAFFVGDLGGPAVGVAFDQVRGSAGGRSRSAPARAGGLLGVLDDHDLHLLGAERRVPQAAERVDHDLLCLAVATDGRLDPLGGGVGRDLGELGQPGAFLRRAALLALPFGGRGGGSWFSAASARSWSTFRSESPSASWPCGCVLPSMILLGFGAGMALNPILLAAMGDVDPSESGLASGVVNTSFMMGGALGLAVLASIAASRTTNLLGSGHERLAALDGGYQLAFVVGAVFAAVAASLAALLLRAGSTASAPASATAGNPALPEARGRRAAEGPA